MDLIRNLIESSDSEGDEEMFLAFFQINGTTRNEKSRAENFMSTIDRYNDEEVCFIGMLFSLHHKSFVYFLVSQQFPINEEYSRTSYL